MNAMTKLSSKGQVVIPKDVRDALGWSEGQELQVVRSGDRAVLQPRIPKRNRISWEEFERRVPKYDGPPATIEDMDAAIESFWRERATQHFDRD